MAVLVGINSPSHSTLLENIFSEQYVTLVQIKPILRFRLDKDVRTATVRCFQQQPRQFLAEEIHCVGCEWDACLNIHGDYFNDPLCPD